MALALLIATARLTSLLKPLMAATVTVVLPEVFGLRGIVFGARPMAKSGVSAGGTTLTVTLRVWVMAPLVPVITRGYLPSVARLSLMQRRDRIILYSVFQIPGSASVLNTRRESLMPSIRYMAEQWTSHLGQGSDCHW